MIFDILHSDEQEQGNEVLRIWSEIVYIPAEGRVGGVGEGVVGGLVAYSTHMRVPMSRQDKISRQANIHKLSHSSE